LSDFHYTDIGLQLMEKYFGKVGWNTFKEWTGNKTLVLFACGPATRKLDALNEIQQHLRT
jgi:hypothetical protein